MRDFDLAGFAAHVLTLAADMEHANHVALERAAVIVETEAKDVIGTYRYGWPPLAPSTLARKAADTPLLETGEMRDSIEHVSNSEEANIGSNNDKALWHELGTKKIPPRSFLAGAAMHKGEEVAQVIGRTITSALVGEMVIGPNTLLRQTPLLPKP